MLEFKEITYNDNELLKQSLDIYLTHFPPQETRPLEKTISMIEKDNNYHIIATLQDNKVIGISLLIYFHL